MTLRALATLVDEGKLLNTSNSDLILSNVSAAFEMWSKYINGSDTIEIEVVVLADLGSAAAQASSVTNAFLTKDGGKDVFIPGAAAEIISNVDPNGSAPDIRIFVSNKSIASGRFALDRTPFDETPETGGDKFDAVSVLAHEIGHGLGFNGYFGSTEFNTLKYESTLDRYLRSDGSVISFFGPKAVEVNKGPVGFANSTHIDPVREGADLLNPSDPFVKRLYPSDIDIAILMDANVPTIYSDTLFALPTGGVLDVGLGTDTVIFNSQRSSYKIIQTGSQISLSLGNTSWTLIGDERLKFSDGLVAFDTGAGGAAGQGYRLYQAAFNRKPDKDGLSYWIKDLDGGDSLANVAAAFVSSAEFKAVYGSSPTNGQIVDKFYQNVLGRSGEAGGVTYWTGTLDRGVSVGDVLAGFAQSPENQALTAPAISGGIELTLSYFA